MLIPLTHEQMTVQRLPWITILIMIANVYVFLITNPQAQREEERLYGVLEELHDFAARNPGIAEEHFSNEESLAEYQTLVARLQEVNQDQLHVHHDALEFPDGKNVLLTHLCKGQRATVLQLPALRRVTVDDAQRHDSLVV